MQLMKSLVLLAGLAPAGSGEIAWQIQGQLSKDAYHRLYQIRSSEHGSQLSRVDGKNGQMLWEIQGQPYVGFNADCVDAQRLYVLVGDRVQALDVESGALIWSEHVNQEFVDNAGYLSCFRGSDQLFVSYTLDKRAHNKFSAVRKSDGKTLWTYVSEQAIAPIGADAERVYLSYYTQTRSVTHALDQSRGHELWQREDEGAYFQFDAYQRLIRHGQGDLGRVDTQTGKDLWRIPIRGSYIHSQSLSDAIYAQTDIGVTRLDAEAGEQQWAMQLIQNADSYTSTQILKNGDVLLRSSLYAENQTRFKILQALSGQTLWEHTVDGLDVFIIEDQDGHLFEQTPSTLNWLDSTGQTIWSFQIPALRGKPLKLGSVLSAERKLFITLFESTGKHPPTSLAAVDWQTGTVNWIYEANEPLSFISLDDPSLIILGTMLSGRSFALYQ